MRTLFASMLILAAIASRASAGEFDAVGSACVPGDSSIQNQTYSTNFPGDPGAIIAEFFAGTVTL